MLSVAELNRRLKRLVENEGAGVQVVGEVASLKEVASGHAYFTLKDEHEDASINCVMYRTAPPRARRLLADGARIILVACPTFYAPRGRLQLIVSDARPLGRGALLEALERLKQKLFAEGLFDKARKRPLPREPRVIGVVTSGDGAAIHDIAKVAFRRGNVRLLLARANVQGAGAAQKMARAIDALCQVAAVQAIILGRGGGLADDLSAFNDELLVRKVAASRVPIVSAVGHEVDTTLTDLAADARAATPSHAAELLVPDSHAQAEAVGHLVARLARAMRTTLDLAYTAVERQRSRLGTPERLLAHHRDTLDEIRLRLGDVMRRHGSARRTQVTRLQHRLLTQHPSRVIARTRGALDSLDVRLSAAVGKRLANHRREVATLRAGLDALSPRAVLGRGYAIVLGPSGRALLDATSLHPGDPVTVYLNRGSFGAEVVSLSDPTTDTPSDPQTCETARAAEPH